MVDSTGTLYKNRKRYFNILGATVGTFVLKVDLGILHNVNINAVGVGSITTYDNTEASGVRLGFFFSSSTPY